MCILFLPLNLIFPSTERRHLSCFQWCLLCGPCVVSGVVLVFWSTSILQSSYNMRPPCVLRSNHTSSLFVQSMIVVPHLPGAELAMYSEKSHFRQDILLMISVTFIYDLIHSFSLRCRSVIPSIALAIDLRVIRYYCFFGSANVCYLYVKSRRTHWSYTLVCKSCGIV